MPFNKIKIKDTDKFTKKVLHDVFKTKLTKIDTYKSSKQFSKITTIQWLPGTGQSNRSRTLGGN